ncbi:MAG: hypothetical protein JNJ77_16035 [Planctomycetia bacterium]|nr:hypothetical protein [Planctomycetia bacterium]
MSIKSIESVRVLCAYLLILTPGFLTAGIMGLSVSIGHKGPKAPLVFIPVAFYITTMIYPGIYLVCSLFAYVMLSVKWLKTAFIFQVAPIAIPVSLFLLMLVLPGRFFVDPPLDVTQEEKYEFKEFQGTIWRTKTRVVLADITDRQDRTEIIMLAPCSFDRNHPEYSPPYHLTVIKEIPIGTKIRINRLLETFGNAGGLDVEGTIDDGTTFQLCHRFLNKNKFIYRYWDKKDVISKWGVNQELLESVE